MIHGYGNEEKKGFECRRKIPSDPRNIEWKKISWRVSGIWPNKFCNLKDL